MGTKLKVMLFWVVLGFALVLTFGLSFFVYASSNESLNLSGTLAYEPSIGVFKHYKFEETNSDAHIIINVTLFDDGTLLFEEKIDEGSQTMGMTMGATYTKGEIAYLFQPTSLYSYMAVDGIISAGLEWNEEDGENEVYKEVESFMGSFHIYEHAVHIGQVGWFFESSYTPSETDVILHGFLANGMGTRSNLFDGLTGTETIGEFRSKFDERVNFVLDKTDPNNQSSAFDVDTRSAFEILKLDGAEATDDMVVSLGYHTAEVSCEYNGQTYKLTVDFVTTN